MFSALRRNPLQVDPLAGEVVGEFSYCSISGKRLIALADHYATHPVYYCGHASGTIAVANDPRPLLILEGLEPGLNEHAVREFLSTPVMVGENELDGQQTFFKGVSRLRPGALLVIQDGRIRVQPSGLPRFQPCTMPSRRLSQDAWAEWLKEILCACVADRIAAGANSINLSGGVDSACVLGACLEIAPGHAPLCLNMSFKDPALVMSQDQNLLRAYFQEKSIPNIILYGDTFLRFQDQQDPLYFLDGPDPSAHPLSKEAFSNALAGQGDHLALTGEGGDIVLGETTAHLIMDSIYQADGVRSLSHYLVSKLGLRRGSWRFAKALLAGLAPWTAILLYGQEFQDDGGGMKPPSYLLPQLPPHGGTSPQNPGRGPGRYLAHQYLWRLLWPRPTYFDAINATSLQSHPFLDPRMLGFLFTCPPHFQHDLDQVSTSKGYAATKMLGRLAFRNTIPSYLIGKRHKTTYAMMARKMFINSNKMVKSIIKGKMLLAEMGIVDQPKFREQFCIFRVAAEDPNFSMGIYYHFLRGVIDLERWLAQWTTNKSNIQEFIRFKPLRTWD